MDQVISKDKTAIAYQRSGAGASLVLVHGTNGDHTRWAAVQKLLAEHFTIYAMDRRGRGESGDGPEYSIEREYEDIAAVANSIDGPVDVLGHSFGAACVLGVARNIPHLRRLILYEPPMLKTQHTPQRAEMLEKMDQELAAGNPEGVILLMLRSMLNIPEPMIEKMRAHPTWTAQFPGAFTIPRELHVSDAYGADLEGYKTIRVPTLFLLGSESPAFFRATTETLNKTLPDSRIAVMAGQ